ncbi:L,D-transpeptidase [Butyrivibrio sp. INlla16]|uniref:L,D-transpeptidase n=1 Tax=Butyrivibrio sp. INlla16 TaxID=1520807 RepID=UPI000884ABB1|nr:L,D-transpeptidase [Butyrivibrio sp. INlla16]SDB31067.1 L,D-transpeptidase catalytic domain [Butyrivibrio sp. INlla16]
MNKRGILYTLLAFSVLSLIAVYLMLGFYYNDTYAYGTWINNIYCTGKTAEEANTDLINNSYYSGMIISSAEGEKFFIDANAIDFKVDYYDELKKMLDDQNPFAWGINLLTSRSKKIPGNPTFDENKLMDLLSTWAIFDVERSDSYELKSNDEGFYLEVCDQKTPNFDKFYESVKEGFYNKVYELDLSSNKELYDVRTITENDKELKALYDKIESVQNIKASIKIGENLMKADSSDLADWIVKIDELEEARDEDFDEENPGKGFFLAGDKMIEFPDEDYKVEEEFITDKEGNLLLSCSKIYDFVCEGLRKYDTNNCIERYQKGQKSTIYVSGNKNGKLYDEKQEFEDFVNSVEGMGPAETEITFPNKSFAIDAKELGDEYILVDMGNQRLRYYKNGKLTIQYDIVTGNTALGRGTPVGLFHIYNKRYHTILRGVDYASYVNYWLGVNKGIGIHDATWRSEFGGEIYKHSGSHGCINSPLDLMERLYELVDVGVPVLLYY